MSVAHGEGAEKSRDEEMQAALKRSLTGDSPHITPSSSSEGSLQAGTRNPEHQRL